MADEKNVVDRGYSLGVALGQAENLCSGAGAAVRFSTVWLRASRRPRQARSLAIAVPSKGGHPSCDDHRHMSKFHL